MEMSENFYLVTRRRCAGSLTFILLPPIANRFSMTWNPSSFRLFGSRAICTAFNTQVCANDIIMWKDHEIVYHVSCFWGCNCKQNLSVGDRCIIDRTNSKKFFFGQLLSRAQGKEIIKSHNCCTYRVWFTNKSSLPSNTKLVNGEKEWEKWTKKCHLNMIVL